MKGRFASYSMRTNLNKSLARDDPSKTGTRKDNT